MHFDNRFLVFSVAGEQYAVALKALKEILGHQEITRVPFTPDDLLGVLNLRGQVVSVVDLRARFGLPAGVKSTEISIMILEHNKDLLGLWVDSVDFVVNIAPEQLEPPPQFSNDSLNNYAQAVARLERQLIVILSSEKLFSFEESGVSPQQGVPAAMA
jgi:purine-binding chemotaxis protein CheW